MMGVGKSTIGKKLAKKLKRKFRDIDQLIEEKENLSIRDIFEKKGESYFRKIEKKITLEELKKTNLIIALGGGAFVNSTIRKEVKNSALSIWLDLNLKSIISRLRNVRKRPLLNKDNLEETLNKIYSERKKFYNESDFRIKCSSLNINKIVNKITRINENERSKV
tara:strand:- start:12170 stop:12664 length:495 start_codon:yes stop_codon:yes gene_type:complete